MESCQPIRRLRDKKKKCLSITKQKSTFSGVSNVNCVEMSEEGSATCKVAYHIVAVLASGTGVVSEVSRKHPDRSQGTPAHPSALGQAGAPPALHPATIKTAYRLAGRKGNGQRRKQSKKAKQ